MVKDIVILNTHQIKPVLDAMNSYYKFYIIEQILLVRLHLSFWSSVKVFCSKDLYKKNFN